MVRTGVLFVFLVLGARATHLTLADTRAEELGNQQSLTRIELAAARGGIFDRSRKELALTIMAPSVYVSPTELKDRDATVRKLARALGIPQTGLAERLADREKFTYVARWVAPERAARVAELELPGVGIVREPRRAFPTGSLAGRLLGFANIDGVGVRGIEQQEDSWLRGHVRTVAVERDAKGQLLATATLKPEDVAGGDVALTIDAAMQAEAEAALRQSVAKSGAAGGLVISLNPRTGEILALAEEPAFDPNRFRQIDYVETRSRAFLDALEPGSTLKVFLVAAALEADVVDRSTQLDCTGGSYQVKGKTIRDHRDYGVVDLTRLLGLSSNCGAVQVAERLGAELHYDALRRLGFGARTGSGFPFESAGLLRPWRDWKPVDQATVAFGQGLSVTPVQLAAALGAIANGGTWIAPSLVAARRAPRTPWQREPAPDSHRAFSRETASEVRHMMESVVSSEGTGRRAGLRGLRVAGKTGTAQKLDVERGQYSQTRYTAWFMGAVPADDPRLVVVVALDEPQGLAHGGGDVAAPLFAQVAADQLARLGIATAPEPFPLPKVQTLIAESQQPARESRPAIQSEDEDPPTATDALASNDSEPPASMEPVRVQAKKNTSSTAQDSLPSVAAAPSRVLYRPASVPAVDENGASPAGTVFVPEFRGSTVAEAKQLATEHTLEIELLGHGLAVAQDPAPGTILTGARRRVRIHFTTGTGEG
jgi:cell division protein FtsI (penicillin-binding protein 3)